MTSEKKILTREEEADEIIRRLSTYLEEIDDILADEEAVKLAARLIAEDIDEEVFRDIINGKRKI
jgi:hypothetical protein